MESNRVPFILEAIGVPCQLGAALLQALTVPDVPFLLMYFLYTIATVCVGIAVYMRRASWLILLNAVFLIINIIGLWNSI